MWWGALKSTYQEKEYNSHWLFKIKKIGAYGKCLFHKTNLKKKIKYQTILIFPEFLD